MNTENLKVGDFVKITTDRDPKNWAPQMDKYKGRIVEVAHVRLEGSSKIIRFEGYGEWDWVDTDGHFTNIDPKTERLRNIEDAVESRFQIN